VSSIALRVEPAETGYVIRAEYRLHADSPDDRRPIAIDCTGGVLQPFDLRLGWSGDADGGGATLPVHGFALPPERASWSDGAVHATFRWEPCRIPRSAGDVGPVLVLPDGLPRLLEPIGTRPRSVVPVPRLTITGALPISLGVAGLHAGPRGVGATADAVYLQLGLLERRDWWEGDHGGPGRVILTGRAASGLSIADRDHAVGLVNRAMGFLAGRYDHAIDTDVIIDFENATLRTLGVLGICLSAEPQSFGISEDPAELRLVTIVKHLSTIWLGVGCSIAGPYRVSIATGIGAALAITLLDALGEARLAHGMLEGYVQSPAPVTSGPADEVTLFRSIVGGLSACAMAMSGSLLPLQEFVRDRWGSMVSREEMLAVLREIGVDLPQRLIADGLSGSEASVNAKLS
jgi:hypothetical protein